MEELYIATLIILFLAVAATVLSHLLKISIALIEIVMGIAGGFFIHGWFPSYEVGINSAWFTVLASVGALMLTFLAGSELEVSLLKKEWKTSGLIGVASFLTPFLE
jgi:glutathione-regulated potassium-efflux system ancillary protein KefC